MDSMSTEMISRALGAAHLGVWEWDVARGSILCSPIACEIFGLTPASQPITTQRGLELVHPEDRASLVELMRPCLEGSREAFCSRHRVITAAQRTRWVVVRGQATSFVQDATALISGTVCDITQLRHQDELTFHTRKIESMGRFAGSIAHDFNNLLTVLMSSGDMLAEDVRELPQSEDLLDLIVPMQQAVERGAGLTRQLLAFSHRQVSTPRLCEPEQLLTSAHAFLSRIAGAHHTLTLTIRDALPTIYVDANMFEQVLMNLVANARDALHEPGTITVLASSCKEEEEAAWLEVSVRDDGVGMPEYVQTQAFEPFFSTRGSGRGTGLGLATSRSIIKQFGGHISLESTPGEGTVCTFRLPGALPHALGAPPQSSELDCSGHEVLLIVEDDLLVRQMAVTCFESLGYRVLQAQDGLEALELARAFEQPIDLLLTDIMMPRMRGDELAQQLLEERPGIRVIFTTGYVGDERLHDLLRSQEHPVIPKPYTPSMLAAQVRQLLDRASA